MDELEWRAAVERFALLKQTKSELEEELESLRGRIIRHCEDRGLRECDTGEFRVKLTYQERKEYDDDKLYHALPDAEVWRMISKSDPGKIAGMVKLRVLNEEALKHTYTVKPVCLVQVKRKQTGNN
ncbi:hypothetical protein ACE6ED_14295 [Paenibacillus sp. CN-4]|uniref:hypothetical protein n=1 Tax=Paenibacillus nanchangensis TaxID=3348343 RepID=UPI00397C4847